MTAAPHDPANAPDIAVERDLECTMRDGTVLRADVYRPAGGGRYPVLVNRTPYGKREQRYVNDALAVARRGYVMVIQDHRGRYASDGEYRWMFRDRTETPDADDGYDTVEWAARLPWSDGRVGTWGHSNASWASWMLAGAQPPSLAAALCSGMGANLLSMTFGIFETGRRLEWTVMQAADARRRAGAPFGPYTAVEAMRHWNQVERSKYLWWLPLGEIPAAVFAGLDDQLQAYHRAQNREFMRFAELHPKVQVPVMMITGWWDRLVGTIDNYVGLATHGPEHLRGRHRLVVGPWGHDVTAFHGRIGPVDHGAQAARSYAGMIARWYDYQLKGLDDGIAAEDPVQLFILGADRWRGEREWPLARTSWTDFHLRGGGSANTVRGDGVLSAAPPPAESPPDRYVYDPRDPVMSLMSADAQAAPVDQSPHDHRADILVYQTPPLDADLEVTGPVTLTLWAATDGPDTDWTARLAVVHEDGLCVNLTYGILRASYRDGYANPAPVQPGRAYEYVIRLNPVGILFRRGQRIRLYVSSSDFPNFDRNHNTGRDYWSDAELRPARQTVYHDAARPSRLTLPVIPD